MTVKVALLMPGLVAGLEVDHLALEARGAPSTAGTCAGASRPSPATPSRRRPDGSSTIAFLRSCSPPSIFLVSPASTSFGRSSRPAARSSPTGSPAWAHSTSTPRSSARRLQRLAQILIVFEASSALQQLLGGRLVLPEIRSGDTLFYSGEFVGRSCGVKDGSAGRTPAWRDPDTGEAARRVEESWLVTILSRTTGDEERAGASAPPTTQPTASPMRL